MQNFIVINVLLSLQFILAAAYKYLPPRAVSRCVCSSLLQAQIEIAPRSRDGFLQLFEGRKSTRRQAGGISSSRGTGCKTLLLVWPSETRVARRSGKWLLRCETRNTVDLSCQRETREYDQSGTLKHSACRNAIFQPLFAPPSPHVPPFLFSFN